MPANPANLGIFGGTFDPVHTAHLRVADAVRRALDLDRVLLVVANEPWQKEDGPVAPVEDRYAMVEAAVEGWPGLEASRIEIDRGGPSYTIDTVRALLADQPGAALVLVVGADVAAELGTWKDEADLRGLVTLAVVGRPGTGTATPVGWRTVEVPVAPFDVSSTELRRRLAAGRSVEGLVPECRHPLHRSARSVRYEEMTVGMRPPDAGTRLLASRLDPPGAEPGADAPRLAADAGVTGQPGPTGPSRAPGETRRAIRVARRRRRQLAVVCAVAVAVCLALTLLIVALARDRAWWAPPPGRGLRPPAPHPTQPARMRPKEATVDLDEHHPHRPPCRPPRPVPQGCLVAARAADDKSGEDTVVLAMGELLGLTDAFVITSGRNPRQVRTIVEEVERRLKAEAAMSPLRIEGATEAQWVLMDYGDFLVHVFLADERRYYDLEHLWSGAPARAVGGGRPLTGGLQRRAVPAVRRRRD